MSLHTKTLRAALKANRTAQVAKNGSGREMSVLGFTAAPTAADTSVSRQTGLAGIWNKSFDPASLTLPPQSGATSTMRNNTLVVRPKNRCAALQIQSERRVSCVTWVRT